MDDEKPKNIKEYKNWLKTNHNIEISSTTKIYYDNVITRIKSDLEKSIFWKQLIDKKLIQYDEEYYVGTKGYHLVADYNPIIYTKSFDSFLLKTFRKNILENNNWPNEPLEGWVLPTNWFCKINDIIRTMIIVKYLDGVEFMIGKMNNYCDEYKKKCKCSLEAKEEGYYAAHFYTNELFEIPKINWDTESINVLFEIQITTQLQEVIKKLLHKYYEKRRETSQQEDTKWQWNFKSDEFVTNYLGHILHYVEGMIMEIREKQRSD